MTTMYQSKHRLSPSIGSLDALVVQKSSEQKTAKKADHTTGRKKQHLAQPQAILPPLPHIGEQKTRSSESLKTLRSMLLEFSTSDIDTILMACNKDEREVLLKALTGDRKP